MAQNRRLLIAIAIVAALGLAARFGLTSVRLDMEVYYASAPDELPSFVAIEAYVCPDCVQAIRQAYAQRHTVDPSTALPAGTALAYDRPTENGFCQFHPETKLVPTRDLPLPPSTVENLPPETEFINRMYAEKGVPPESVSPIDMIVVISQRDRRSIHRPESCLYSQGFSQNLAPVQVALACPGVPGGKLTVRELRMERPVPTQDGRQVMRGLVVETWYAAPPDRLTPTETSYLAQMFYDRLIRGVNYRWSSVLISRQVYHGQDPDAVSEQVRRFVQEFSEWAEEQRAGARQAESR